MIVLKTLQYNFTYAIILASALMISIFALANLPVDAITVSTLILHLTIAVAIFITLKGYYEYKINFIKSKASEVEEFLTSQIIHLEKSKEKAEQTDNLKSQFLANMSHELRTPMHSILSFSKISLKKIGIIDNIQLIRYIETIYISGSRLLNIINEVLDISRLESGNAVFEFENCDLEELLEETIRLNQSLINDKFQNIETEYAHKNNIIQLDETKISQVLNNLISNAIKFTPENGQIKVCTKDDFLGSVPAISISFEDNGIGIPKSELESIFNKFIQSSKTANGAGGSGLGLCICKEIIDQHLGQIWAKNNDMGGATFTFTIPVQNKLTEKTQGELK